MKYVSLHHHSTYSYMDGYASPDAHAKRAADLGMSGLALTEHGNISSHVKHMLSCQKYGLKPLFGLEAYTAPENMREMQYVDAKGNTKTGMTQKAHLTLLAMNEEGLHNLNQIVTRSWSEGFYRWPTVTGQMLKDHHEGLICLSGCADSMLANKLLGGKWIRKGDERAAVATMLAFKRLFGDRYYLETQQFPELSRSGQLNQWYEEQGKKYGIKLAATSDCHYPFPDDNEMQKILHAAGRNIGTVAAAEAGWEYDIKLTFPTSDQMVYERLRGTGLSKSGAEQAIASTTEIMNRCSAMLPKMDRVRYPIEQEPGFSEGMSPVDMMRKWLNDGWKYRGFKKLSRDAKKNYVARVEYELDLIISKDFVDYFLMLSDAVRHTKDAGIPVGPARGSAAASLVCFLLRITEIDPMLYPQMMFERFIDPNRHDLPDVDLDFDDERRDYVRQHMIMRYGADRVGNIGTYTKYRGKNAIDDVARVYEIPRFEADRVKEVIVERSGGDSRFDATLADTVEAFPQAQEVFEKYPVLNRSVQLEGNIKGFGVHSAGVVVGEKPLHEYVATYTKHNVGHEKKTLQVLSVDKYDGEYLGLLKLDALGLTTMGMIRIALELVGMTLEDLYAISMEDEKTLDAFRRADVVGIFQFEGRTTRMVCQEVAPTTFLELCDINALSRPGPLHSGSTGDYIAVKHGRQKVEHLHPLVDELTHYSQYQIIYQEQILALCRNVGKFPWVHASEIRKVISQKKGEAAFNKLHGQFIEGAASQDIGEELADKIWKRLVTSGTYAFCLTGDAMLQRAGGNQYTPKGITIAEAYAAQEAAKATGRWSNGDGRPTGHKILNRKFKVQQMDDDGRIRPGLLTKIHDPQMARIKKVVCASGRSFRGSFEHKVLTSDGYKLLTDLRVGDRLVAMGEKPVMRSGGVKSERAIGKSYGGKGMPNGEGNPSWIDGRTKALRDAQDAVARRSQGVCEWSDKTADDPVGACGEGRMEFAHINALESFNGDYSKYHQEKNILHLCNNHHKRFDYLKGERKVRDTVGRPSDLDEVVSIEDDGEDLVYEIDMEGPAHNYVANGIVQHNNMAHCVSYSMLAFWCQWLKQHHPLAFYAAQLRKTKPDPKKGTHITLMRDLSDERYGRSFKVFPPDLQTSSTTWEVHPSDRGVQAGFNQIDSIGEKYAQAIIDTRDEIGFESWEDLIKVKGIGPAKMAKIMDFCVRDDPFGLDKLKNGKNVIVTAIKRGQLGSLPIPDTLADDVPYEAVKSRHVILGTVRARNLQDLFENHRSRTGDELDPKDIRDPHLKDSMTLYMEDESGLMTVKVNRWMYPKLKDAIWDIKLSHDFVLMRVEKKAFYGKTIHCTHMWVIDPDD